MGKINTDSPLDMLRLQRQIGDLLARVPASFLENLSGGPVALDSDMSTLLSRVSADVATNTDVTTILARTAVPTADSTGNDYERDAIGNKTDAAVTVVGTTKSLVAYTKGILNRMPTSGTVVNTTNLPTNFGSFSINGSGQVDVIKVNGTSQTARDLGAQLDAAITTRASATDYTAARAGYIDNLNSYLTHQPKAIKNIQRGTVTISSGSASGTATITSVDTSKSELRMLGMNSSSASALTLNQFPMLTLTNSTTITASTGGNTGANMTVGYEITEHY